MSAGAVVASRVRELREKHGWSAQDLADRCEEVGAGDLDRTRIANLESKRRRNVSVDEVLALSLALNVSPLHLFIPVDDEALMKVTDDTSTTAVRARDWIRGTEPLPGMDEKTFRTEVPGSEWEAAQGPSPDEQRALNAMERAEHRLRVAEHKLALVAESPTIQMSLQARALSGAIGQDPSELLERRLDRAWKDVAEAEVYLENAHRKLSALSTRDEGRS